MNASERGVDHTPAGPAGTPQTPQLKMAPSRWLWLAAVLGLAAGLCSFAASRVPYFEADLRITRAVQGADLGLLAAPLHGLNVLGFPPLVDFVYGGILVALFASGQRWPATIGGVNALGGAGLNYMVKFIVDRPRPSAQLVHVEHHIHNPSYPAGHVLDFTAFAGLLCCLLYLRTPTSWHRNALLAVLALMIGLMGVARIASGEHWPSDVLGGYLLGASWLAVTMSLYEWGGRRLARAGMRQMSFVARGAMLVALLTLAPTVLVGTAHAAPVAPDSLGTSDAVPWNPPQALARRTGWEQVVLLPGRIVSLPLSGLGYATDRLLGRFEQSSWAARPGTSAAPRQHLLLLKTPRLGDRSGLGGAVELRKQLLSGPLSSVWSAEYAATLLRYNRTLLTASGRPLTVQYGYEWRPQDRFYGIGNNAPVDSVSDYASQSEFVRAGLAWGSDPGRILARPHSALALWGGPRSRVTRTGRESGEESYETRFPTLAAATLDRRIEHLVYGASVSHDGRAGSPHWSHGWRSMLSVERFDAPIRALALHSATAEGAQFTRLQGELESGFSFMRDPRTLRISLRATDLRVSANANRMLVSDLSTLGGQAGLGGYSPGRFHDLDLVLTRLDYVFPLERRLEVNLHSEWGAVFPDLWSDAKLSALHNSYGFALRVRSDHAPMGSVGLDFSREAVRFRFSIGGVQ